MLGDLKHAVRQLRKSPGFALTAILTLALGIGVNTAIFSVVNAVLRHPAGVDHPERVAVLHTRYLQFTLDIPYVSGPNYATTASLRNLVEAAAIEQPSDFNVVRDGKAEHMSAARVSSQWFRVFAAQPILGRTFTVQEDQPNAGPVAVLSYGLWQQVFGGRSDVIGQTMLLNEKPYRVIGVMRSDFEWPRRSQIWIPIALPPSAFVPDEFFNEEYEAFVRLRPGVSIHQLNAVMSTRLWEILSSSSAGSRYAKSSGWSAYASPLTDFAAGPLRTPLHFLLAVVALVLLIASANVAGLMLARSTARSREFAIRRALGASAGRIARQLLIETSLLAGTACIAGIAAGPLTGRLLMQMVPNHLAAGYTVNLQPAVLVFIAGATLLALLIVGLGPSLKMFHQRGQLQLHEGEKSGTASIDKQRLRSAFVVGEVAVAFLLLAGTGLFLVSLRKLQQVDPGFNPRGVLAGAVHFAGQHFETNQQRQTAFVGGVVSNLAAQPGVHAAAAVAQLPFDPDGSISCSFGIIGRPRGPNDPGPHSQLTFATSEYLKVMQIPLLAGRWIRPGDLATTQPIAVIDTRLAKKYWPGRSPVGQHISFGCDGKQTAVIVGVVAPIRLSSLEEDTSDGMRYYPFAQGENITANFLVRVDGDPNRMTPALTRAVASVDSSQAVSTITSVERLVSDSLAGRSLIVWMLGGFAVLALLLAMVGIYGLISYITAQRTNEVGIRMAVGAQQGDIVRLILGNAFIRVGIGLSAGAAMSMFASALLRRFFSNFGGGILSSLSLAGAVLLVIGLLAGLIPSLRAAKVDPAKALRSE